LFEPRKACLKAAEKARDFLRIKFLNEEYSKILEIHEADVTRKIDVEVEEIIIKTLREEGFKGAIITEERGVVGEGPPYAVVDPLDGSLNFVVGAPYWAVSVAVAEGEDFSSIVASAVCPGFGHPCYSADAKAYAGSEELVPTKPEKVLIFYGEPEDERQTRFLREARKVLGRPKVRTPGAIALDLINLARGKVLAVADVRNKMRNVDIAGAYLILKRVELPLIPEYSKFPSDRIEVIGNILFGRDEKALSALTEAARRAGV